MATPDNANPVIHSTAAARLTAASTHDAGLSWSLAKEQDAAWERSGRDRATSDQRYGSGDEDREEDVDEGPADEIDRDEIFGMGLSLVPVPLRWCRHADVECGTV